MGATGTTRWALLAAAGAAGLLAWMALWGPPSGWTVRPWAVRGLGAAVGAWVWGVLYAVGRARGWGRADGRWRRAIGWAVIAAACWSIGQGAASFWLKDEFWYAALTGHMWPPIACIGALVALSGWRRRVGEVVRCAACDYEKGPGSGPVCPECGARWDVPRGTVLGTRRWRARRIGVGVVVMLAVYPLARWVDSIPGGGVARRIAALMPTDLLIHLVTPEGHDGRKDWHTWSELQWRAMSARQERLLARRVLTSRRWRGVLSLNAEAWIAQRAMAGALPRGMVDAYFAGVAEPALRVDRERDGSAVVSVEGVYRPITSYNPVGNKSTPYVARLYFGGFEGEGVAGTQGRAQRWLVIGTQPVPSGSAGRSAMRWTRVSAPVGGGRIAAVFWVVFTSDTTVAAGGPIRWNEDGTPELPADVVWSRRYELEAELGSGAAR